MDKKFLRNLIALLLTVAVLITSVGTLGALENNEEETEPLSFVDETTTLEDETATETEETTSQDEEQTTVVHIPDDNELETTYSTEKENGETIQDNEASTEVVWVGAEAGSSSTPGSQSNPYAVSDAAHFLDMSRLINDEASSLKYFRLTADIDLSSVTMQELTDASAYGLANTIVSVNPTLTNSPENLFFVLDGRNKKITGLNLNDDSRNSLAIFGYINANSEIKNILFDSITLTSNYSSAVAIGPILKNEGTVSECSFKDISVSTVSGNTDEVFAPVSNDPFRVYAGISGAIVDNAGTFTQATLLDSDMTRNITVTSTGNRSYIGGLVAQNRGYIYKTKASNVKVSASLNAQYVGGYVAANYTSATSTSTGAYYVTLELGTNAVKGGNFTGAFAGANTGRMNYCSVNGKNNLKNVLSTDNYDILVYGGKTYGGLVASNIGIIDKCSATNIGAFYADTVEKGIYGGIAGTNTYTIQNSVSTGLVSSDESDFDIYAGGVVGVGSTDKKFYVGNCYTLVKLPDTTATLGCVIGVDGDEPFNNNKVKNCYYSSIVAMRPSPTSFGGAGEAFGDLQCSIGLIGLKTGSSGAVTKNISDFTFSGWDSSSFSLVATSNSFYRDPNEASVITSITVNASTVKLTPGSTGNKVQTIYYDTNITLPEGVGSASSGRYLLSSQPLALKAMTKTTTWIGDGTVESPYEIQAAQLSFITLVPFGNFKLTSTTSSANITPSNFSNPSTFWGTFDGNNITLVSYTATVPLFVGIYGSRDSSAPQQNNETHISDPAMDSASNLRNGVVKNFTYRYYKAYSNVRAVFGNVCNATLQNISIVPKDTSPVAFSPDESNTGVAIKTVYGNSYIYNVYNDGINVTLNKAGITAISGLIGTVDAKNAVIDNCGSKSVITVSTNNVNNCSAFIGEIKNLTGSIQNCYSSGGVKAASSSYRLYNTNYIFCAKSIASANIQNCYYSPSDYYNSGMGIYKPIPEGSYTGTLEHWSFENPMYVVTSADTTTLIVNTIHNFNRFDLSLYDSADGRMSLANYFTSSVNGSGYTCTKIFYTSGISAVLSATATADDSADFYLTHTATNLVAKTSVSSSSDITVDGGYYLIQKPTDLYMICSNQASSATDNGNYLDSSYKFKLCANIDMSGFSIPMWGKSSTYPFKGTLEGEVDANGNPLYTISGLKFNSNSSCGLFGYVDGATIKGIKLEDATLNGGIYTGALIGQVLTSVNVENCCVSNSSVKGNSRVGALIGGVSDDSPASSPTTIRGCSVVSTAVTANTPQITGFNVDNPSMCGGIIGCVGSVSMENETKYALISNCSVSDSKITANNYDVGGIVGIASCADNTVSNCTVTGTVINSAYTAVSTASLGGIAGTFGGLTVSGCNLVSSEVSGENASGIVSRIVNLSNVTTITNCQVNDSDITGISYAGGISAYIGAYSSTVPIGDKVITSCVIDEVSNITAKVSGGFIGVIMNYNNRVLSLSTSNCYATVTTTGDKGSTIQGAGGFIGRLANNLYTSGISVTSCVSGGTVTGSATLSGGIAIINSNEHNASTALMQNCYFTTIVNAKTLKANKGLIAGYVNLSNSSDFTKLSQNSVFSSYGQSINPYGNITDTNGVSYLDVNLGADKTSGITVTSYSTTVATNNVVSGDGTNTITLKENTYASYSSAQSSAQFNVGNTPSVSGFAVAKAGTNYWVSANDTKLSVGTSAAYNRAARIVLLTHEYKGRVGVYTYFSNSDVNGYPVSFTIGFTVVCSGTHKFDGAGSIYNPYKIYDAEDLIAIKEHHDSPLANEDGSSFYSATYVLMNDIDLSSVCVEGDISRSFPAIGTANEPFCGTLSSNSGAYTIRNLYQSVEASGYAGSTEMFTGYSDNYGLFGYLDGASISDIVFENASIIGGNNSGVVAGKATNSTISNITIEGKTQIEECSIGGILIGTSNGNLNVSQINISDAQITAQGSVGGIVAIASQCQKSTIANFSLTNCTIESQARTSAIYAGAVAGQIDGYVMGNYSGDEKISSSKITNCTVIGVIAAGVVGGGSPNSGDNHYGLIISGVDVKSTQISSPANTSNSTAAGILGRTFESYDYEIKDCTVDSASSCDAYCVAAGILGQSNITSSIYGSSLLIENCQTSASLSQRITGVSETYGGDRKICGAGGVIGLISQSSVLRQSSDDSAAVKIRGCTVGGEISGSINIGGIIGQIASTDVRLQNLTEHIVDNCIVTSAFSINSQNGRVGLVTGAVEGNIDSSENYPFPDRNDYTVYPFNNIYYSSYQTSKINAFGKSAFYNYQQVDFTRTIYDLNSVVWRFTNDGNDVEMPIAMIQPMIGSDGNPMTVGSTALNISDYYFSSEFRAKLGSSYSGDLYNGFTIGGNEFTLDSITSSDPSVFTVTTVNDQLRVNYYKFGTADMIFNYSNGLQIAIQTICGVSYEGEGTVESPIIVSVPEIFAYVVPILPNYYFKQTVDLDLTRYTISPITDFGGHYDGQGFSINNAKITSSSGSSVGIFSNVTGTVTDNAGNVIPNITNVTFSNTKILADGCTNVGAVAGSLSNGASISGVTVDGATVNGTSNVGGIVGTVEDATISNSTIAHSTITATSGAAGGVAGVMNNSSSTVTGCFSNGNTIASGTFDENDIAGGIVGKAVGTVQGRGTETDTETGKQYHLNAVQNSTVSAYIAGGAVGSSFYSTASLTSNLAISDVTVSNTTVNADYSSSKNNPSGAGILAFMEAESDHRAEISISDCFVDKQSEVNSSYCASGCLGVNKNAYIDEITITDSEAYATVTSSQKSNGKIVYAGGMISLIKNDIDPNIITMNGCVAGGNITANAWNSYAGGAVGYVNSALTIDTEFFANGVLSASVYANKGENDTSQNPVNLCGKCIGAMSSSTLFEDNAAFKTVVFHDIYYSSYPQDIVFFGNQEIDSYQIIEKGVTPFKDINTNSNFTISENATVAGPWNTIAIAKDLNIAKTFHVKFNEETLTYGNGKVSSIDLNGFSVQGTTEDHITVFEIDENVTKSFDAGIGTYYSFSIIPRAYGAGKIGASYECGLATSLPILCVEINGTGAQNDPYQITNPIQLYVVGYLTASGNFFKQMNDIDLTDTYRSGGTATQQINYNAGKGFNPIGNATSPFCGNYDGQGYKITGLYINRNDADNIGLFGVVSSTSSDYPATIKNVHVELLESNTSTSKTNGILGRNNVAGLVGKISGSASNAVVDNCSVTHGNVIGSNFAGGLIGEIGTSVNVTGSFTQCDVFSSSDNSSAGGLAGTAKAGTSSACSLINKSFSASNVYAKSNSSSNTAGNAGGIIGYASSGEVSVSNCLFTGSTNSGHGIVGQKGSTGGSILNVISSVDAGRNIAMENGHLAPCALASTPTTSSVVFTNSYYDKAMTKARTVPSGLTALFTSDLVKPDLAGISTDNWTYADNSYPVPNVKSDDNYSKAYASLLSIAILSSEDEEIDDIEDTNFGRGFTYPVKLLSGISAQKITYSSSIFDLTDTVEYPSGYDANLYGVGTNKNTDLLFEDKTDTGLTSVYRNVFREDTSSQIANLTAGSCLSNGEVMFNLQIPVISASVMIDGVSCVREIKLPLSYDRLDNTYCISTERQLFALGLAANETAQPESKFANFYGPGYNYKLITDVEIDESNTTNFVPIGINDANGFTGTFDGSNHRIVNLRIKQTANKPTGMFSVVSKSNDSPDFPEIKNLNLVDAKVEGVDYVGALVGKVNGNVNIINCSASGNNSTVTASGSFVGGLIGSVENRSSNITECTSSVAVSGKKDSIGGLIGKSSGIITACYATGAVSTQKLESTGGVGGLIGYMQEGTVTESFASGIVTVHDYTSIISTNKTYGVGGFVGISDKFYDTDGITKCFSGGSVKFGDEATGEIKPSLTNIAIVGIGGFSGVNYAPITNCYSSASVTAAFETIKCQSSTATYGVGIGGVCGVALGNVQNVYSSGATTKPDIVDFDSTNGKAYYGVGGAVGTKMDSSVSVSNCFYDSWKNSDKTMTAIGDMADSGSYKSYTTEELTSGSLLPGFDSTVWGATTGAYPYLKGLLNEDVSNIIKANSILSVIVVEPDKDDYSARQGQGITMAITVPTLFKYVDFNTGTEKTYNLIWSGANLDTETNKITPIRTKNTSEFLNLSVCVEDLEEYGSRSYEHQCADMRGTYNQPYLIGTLTDYQHVNMTVAEHEVAKQNYDNFYDQWATPLDEQNQQAQGTVYYQLMTSIDTQTSSRKFADLTNVQYSFTQEYSDEHGDLQQRTENITYNGFVLNGNGYSIKNVNTTGSYFEKIDENSALTNISFEDISVSQSATVGDGSALIKRNLGNLTDVYVNGQISCLSGTTDGGLCIDNGGVIDGCVCDLTINNCTSATGMIAANNLGTIKNSASAGTINIVSEAPTNVAAFVAVNGNETVSGTIENCFTMVQIKAIGTGKQNYVSSFVSRQKNGSINGCYTRGSIEFTNAPASDSVVSLLVSDVVSGTVSNCFTAGNLGFFANTQHSIAFVNVSENATVNEIYVDKAMAGGTSAISFKYATPTVNLIGMDNMGDSMNEYFTKDESAEHYPQISSIITAKNTERLDENDNVIVFEEGTVIRNYDILKQYAKVANATVITSNSQYIDSLKTDSYRLELDSTVSTDVTWNTSASGVINVTSGKLSTTATGGTVTLSASSPLTTERGVVLNPVLNIKVVTGQNPNFTMGYGTEGNPYRINNVNSLQSLSYYGSNKNLYFVLNNSIDCSGVTFEQIPLFSAKLNYNLNSNNLKYVIYNLDLTDGGLFKTVDADAYVGNMGIVGAKVNSTGDYTGILASNIVGATVENILCSGEVNGAGNTGLLAGCVSSGATITGIITSGYVSGTDVVGGVAGAIDSSNLCDVTSTAYVDGNSNVGGIAGQIVNESTVDDVIFAGSSTGCAVTSVLNDSALTDYYVDSQFNISTSLVDSQTVNTNNLKSSKKLSSVLSGIDGFVEKSDSYIIPEGFAVNSVVYANSMFYAGVEMASRIISIRSGAGTGTINKYTAITMGDRISAYNFGPSTLISDFIKGHEVQYGSNPSANYLQFVDDTDNQTLHVEIFNFDKDVKTTAVKLYLDTNNSNNLIFNSTDPYRIFRYITPDMVKTVNVSYELSDTTSELNGQTVGILLRSLYNETVDAMADATNIFTKVGSASRTVDSMSVSSKINGFYVDSMLPSGYKMTVTATDGSGNELGVITKEGQRGLFIDLTNSQDSNVSLSVSISKDSIIWGLNRKDNNIW